MKISQDITPEDQQWREEMPSDDEAYYNEDAGEYYNDEPYFEEEIYSDKPQQNPKNNTIVFQNLSDFQEIQKTW
jgi:hypothetical protein